MRLYKDYELCAGVLIKYNLKEDRHLLRNFGGVPAVDAGVWDANRDSIEGIRFRTDKGRTFAVDHDTFEANKEEISLGYGRQYIISKNLWTIK